jgi:hypothetical protein
MDFVERYRNGEYEQVWNDLQNLGTTVRDEPLSTQARHVAAETMRRVRRNCERLVTHLRALGYVFGTFPDGSRRSEAIEPLTPPSTAMRNDCAELEAECGPLPLSLVSFWQEVGSVDLVGMHPSWPDGLDPLVVEPPEGALALLSDVEEDEEETRGARWFAGLAPDDLHKDNVSGGDPYGLYLPTPSADFLFLNQRHGLHFVPYLRLAILDWGGFPGLANTEVPFEPLHSLVAGLEPF